MTGDVGNGFDVEMAGPEFWGYGRMVRITGQDYLHQLLCWYILKESNTSGFHWFILQDTMVEQ